MVAFDADGRITKYDTPEDILKAFFTIRIRFYEKRKVCFGMEHHQPAQILTCRQQYLLSLLHKELDKFTNQARFVQMIIDGKLVISKKPKAKLIQELKDKGFKPMPKGTDAAKQGENEPFLEESEEEKELGSDIYDYLLGVSRRISNLGPIMLM